MSNKISFLLQTLSILNANLKNDIYSLLYNLNYINPRLGLSALGKRDKICIKNVLYLKVSVRYDTPG